MGKGNGDEVLAVHCGCDQHLDAADLDGQVGEVLGRLGLDHPELGPGGADVRAVREIVAARAYRFEWMAVHAQNTGLEEAVWPDTLLEQS